MIVNLGLPTNTEIQILVGVNVFFKIPFTFHCKNHFLVLLILWEMYGIEEMTFLRIFIHQSLKILWDIFCSF